MSEQKTYDNEMRGSLWFDADRTNDKAPAATGTVTISGLELRIAMWPKRVAKVNGSDKTYWPISVQYRQGTKFVLAKVNPAHIVVTGATSEPAAPADSPASAEPVGDMPF